MLLQTTIVLAIQLATTAFAQFANCPIGFTRVRSACFCTSVPTNITARLVDPVCPEGWRFDGRLCRCQTFILGANTTAMSNRTGTTIAPTTPRPLPRTCAPGWDRIGNACYFLSTGIFPYATVHSTCNLRGARVVWFETQLEAIQVNALAVSRGIRTYWLGMQLFQGQWIWSNGALPTFFNWRPGQPDRCCGSFVWCALVNFEGTSGQWDDAGCSEAWPRLSGYICKTTL